MKRKASTAGLAAGSKPKRRKADVVMATQAKRLSALQNEQKYNDNAFNTDATATGTITPLSNIAAGDTVLTREGNKILVTAIELRSIMQIEVTTVNAIIRWVLVHDKNANGTSPTYAQVFGSTSVSAFPVIGNKSRFTILMDKTMALTNYGAAAGSATGQFYIHKFKKIPEKLQLACFTDGTAAVPVSGSFTLFYASNQAAGVNDIDIEGNIRLYFKG